MFTKQILPIAFLLVTGTSLLGTANTGCDQPKPKCSSSHGDYIVRYTYVSGPAKCKERTGEVVGVQTYNAIGESAKPDLDHASVALQGQELSSLYDNAAAGGVKDPDPNDKEYSVGSFSGAEPVNDVCTVPTLTVAQQQLAAVTADEEAGTTDQPATLINYTWKNVQFLVTSQYYGSQFTGDLDIGVGTEDCFYKAQGLYPYVDCHKLDANGDPAKDANGNGIVDDDACKSEATPPAHPTGSGINPDFPVHCDPVLFACVLNRDGFPVIH